MDALTYAMETYVATDRSGCSDLSALQATSDVFDRLIGSYHGDVVSRGRMHVAQCLAGMAFFNALFRYSSQPSP